MVRLAGQRAIVRQHSANWPSNTAPPADERLPKHSRVRQVGTPAADLTASLQKAKEVRVVPTVPPMRPDPPSVAGIDHSSAIH
jgi:hypothetical protein